MGGRCDSKKTTPRFRRCVQMLNQPILSVKAIEKIYPNGTVALKNASFDVADGTIHGLIGANGAGKSTLIKILSGVIPASSGQIVWRGKTRTWRDPADAAAKGIATIHQHIPLAPTLSVQENVFLASAHPWRNSRSERERFGRLWTVSATRLIRRHWSPICRLDKGKWRRFSRRSRRKPGC